MTGLVSTVHVAGFAQMGGLYQQCARCGHVLQDYTGQEVMVAVQDGDPAPSLPTWQEGFRVGQLDGMSYSIASDRPLDDDERECRPAS